MALSVGVGGTRSDSQRVDGIAEGVIFATIHGDGAGCGTAVRHGCHAGSRRAATSGKLLVGVDGILVLVESGNLVILISGDAINEHTHERQIDVVDVGQSGDTLASVGGGVGSAGADRTRDLYDRHSVQILDG